MQRVSSFYHSMRISKVLGIDWLWVDRRGKRKEMEFKINKFENRRKAEGELETGGKPQIRIGGKPLIRTEDLNSTCVCGEWWDGHLWKPREPNMEANTEAIEPPFPLQFAVVVKPLAKELGHACHTGYGNNELHIWKRTNIHWLSISMGLLSPSGEMELDNMADEN